MSGGSYDYAYRKVEDFAADLQTDHKCCDSASQELREAFKKHCKLVAEAMRACEWNDSCDGDSRETELIVKCLGKDAEKFAKHEKIQEYMDKLYILIREVKKE